MSAPVEPRGALFAFSPYYIVVTGKATYNAPKGWQVFRWDRP